MMGTRTGATRMQRQGPEAIAAALERAIEKALEDRQS